MKLSVEGRLRLAARFAFAAGMSAAVQSVYAQETGAATPTPESSAGAVQLKAVQVTGSRLKQPSLTSTSSMQLISDKEFALQGTTNVESLINSLPQAFAEYSTGDSNGATGTATVNLRNLGSARTLVLVDGKRLMPGDPKLGPQADLNFIPASLVERVEVLSGGSSAVYGSDAIAGVVNFIMKKDFEGFRIDSQLNGTDHGDGSTYDFTALWGTNFAGGKGNVTMYAGYGKTHAITQAQRKFSECSVTTPGSGDKHVCAGSGTIAEGRLYSYDAYYQNADAGLGPDDPGFVNPYFMVDPAGTRNFVTDDGRTFNFAPYNYLQRPDNRYVLGGFAQREINEHVELFGSAMFMDDRTKAQIAPSGLFFQPLSLPCNNPLLSAAQRDAICTQFGLGANDSANVLAAKRTTEIGPRYDDLRHTDYRIVLGARGDIISGVSYEVSAQRGEVIYQDTYINDLSVSRAQNALNVTTDADGNPVCVNDVANGCVPLDIFQFGAITADQANYVRGLGLQNGSVVEQVVSGTITSDLAEFGVKSPWAKNGVGVAFGAEHRSESLDFLPDYSFQTGDLGGQGGPTFPTVGKFLVNELYSELQVPVWEDMPFAKLLQVEGAYRWGNYSNAANDVQSYKLGLKWQPISDATLRASFQRATRAPSIQELTSPAGQGLFGGSDPCAGSNLALPGAYSLEECMRTGVTEAQYNNRTIQDCSSGQCNGFFGGNQDLAAEVSTTRSFGLVLTPTVLKGFTATIDYFDIVVKDAIQSFPQSTLLNCLESGDAESCSKIHRGTNGRLSGNNPNIYVEAINENTASLKTKGVDLEANYRARLKDFGLGNAGTVNVNLVGTYLSSYEQGLPGATYDCAGLYGINCGNPLPVWRHKLRLTWDTPLGLTVSANYRYYGSVTLDKNEQSNPLLKIGAFNSIDNELTERHYLDLSALYTLPTQQRNVKLRFGISNVTGTNPPVVSSNNPNPVSSPPYGNANTFPNVYDALGRVMFVGVTADF